MLCIGVCTCRWHAVDARHKLEQRRKKVLNNQELSKGLARTQADSSLGSQVSL